MSAPTPFTVHYVFPHDYEVKVLESYSLVNPLEKLHQFPAQLEEGDRTGVYLRVTSKNSNTWIGFFALGFASAEVARGVYSCPDSESLCAVVGGYAYVVNASDPQRWVQLELRPVIQVKPVPDLKLLLFAGFTHISGLGESNQLWTTERLSWEGISIHDIQGTTLHGMGWDMITDKEVAFEVDLLTGKSTGGARPQNSRF
jgi:hypothetical protein